MKSMMLNRNQGKAMLLHGHAKLMQGHPEKQVL
jgi:hypothetical protein